MFFKELRIHNVKIHRKNVLERIYLKSRSHTTITVFRSFFVRCRRTHVLVYIFKSVSNVCFLNDKKNPLHNFIFLNIFFGNCILHYWFYGISIKNYYRIFFGDCGFVYHAQNFNAGFVKPTHTVILKIFFYVQKTWI